MNEMEFTFETAPDDSWVQQLMPDTVVSATQLLLHCEGAEETQLEEIFLQLEEKNIQLDLSDLALPTPGGETAKRLQLEQQLAGQGLRPEQLEQTDPLRLYLEELAAIPVCGDICCVADALSKANRTGGDPEALRTQLVELSLSRVVELAGEYTGKGVLLLDLIQEGSMGLWRATEIFDGNGLDFEAFRDRWIRLCMDKAVIFSALDSGVGQKLRTAAEDYRSVDERLLAELGRNPTPEEMAEALHMTVEETVAVAKAVENVRMLNRALKPEPEEIPQEEEQAVEDTAYFQMRQRITELLSVLPEEDAKLLTLRYGLEGGLPLDPQQTAAKLGMTADQVLARETAALAKLRQQ